jgi:hypothetical protein
MSGFGRVGLMPERFTNCKVCAFVYNEKWRDGFDPTMEKMDASQCLAMPRFAALCKNRPAFVCTLFCKVFGDKYRVTNATTRVPFFGSAIIRI